MKKLSICLLTFVSSFLHSDYVKLPNLWEEDPHFIHYRCLVMEQAILSIEKKSHEQGFHDLIHDEIFIIKYCIGFDVIYNKN